MPDTQHAAKVRFCIFCLLQAENPLQKIDFAPSTEDGASDVAQKNLRHLGKLSQPVCASAICRVRAVQNRPFATDFSFWAYRNCKTALLQHNNCHDEPLQRIQGHQPEKIPLSKSKRGPTASCRRALLITHSCQRRKPRRQNQTAHAEPATIRATIQQATAQELHGIAKGILAALTAGASEGRIVLPSIQLAEEGA